eukprot:scaffold4.g4769.t1
MGHACAIGANDSLTCWQFRGNDSDVWPATQVPAGPGDPKAWRLVSAGATHTCAIAADQTLKCWGDNTFGQTTWKKDLVLAVTCGAGHTCVIDITGVAACWGKDADGQADGPPSGSVNGIAIGGLSPTASRWTAIHANEASTCGIREEDRKILCWGYQYDTANASGSTLPVPPRWSQVSDLCAVSEDGELGVWGDLAFIKRQLPPGSRWAQVSGGFTTCAIQVLAPLLPAPAVEAPAAAAPAPPTPLAPVPASSSSGIGIGAIAGIVVAVCACAVLAGIFLWWRRRRSHARRGAALQPLTKLEDGLSSPKASGELDGKPSPSSSDWPSRAKLELAGRGSARVSSGAPSPRSASGAAPVRGAPSWTRSLSDSAKEESAAELLLTQDPLLSYIHTQRASLLPAPRPRREASGSTAAPESRGSAPTDAPGSPGSSSSGLRSWEVPWEDLKMLSLIGTGSFGRVYLAYWRGGGIKVAAKLLLAGGGDCSSALCSDYSSMLSLPVPILGRLEEEASLMASMRHPHCVAFLEYAERGSLADILRAAKADPAAALELTWARRLQLALDAALGCLYLHSRTPPIIHRDLKSPNVDSSWRGKVADFNLSKIIDPGDSNKRLQRSITPGAMNVTNPRWQAPELLRGEEATQASDIYAAGMLLWELLTWEIPFAKTSVFLIASQVQSGQRPPVPPPEQLPGPDNFAFQGLGAYLDLMHACWAQDPTVRPTFQQVADALRAMLESLEGGHGS